MSWTDELLANNAAYAAGFDASGRPSRPAKRVAVVACMDARLDPAKVLGLSEGDAHVLRNAGGVVTDDVLRSLVISQRMLGTEEVMLLHHTDCGMEKFTDEALAAELESETGSRPGFAFGAFADAEYDLRESVLRIKASPFVLGDKVRAFMYDVASGRVREIRLS